MFCLHGCVCTTWKSEECIGSPSNGVAEGCEPPCWSWESDPGSLKWACLFSPASFPLFFFLPFPPFPPFSPSMSLLNISDARKSFFLLILIGVLRSPCRCCHPVGHLPSLRSLLSFALSWIAWYHGHTEVSIPAGERGRARNKMWTS